MDIGWKIDKVAAGVKQNGQRRQRVLIGMVEGQRAQNCRHQIGATAHGFGQHNVGLRHFGQALEGQAQIWEAATKTAACHLRHRNVGLGSRGRIDQILALIIRHQTDAIALFG